MQPLSSSPWRVNNGFSHSSLSTSYPLCLLFTAYFQGTVCSSCNYVTYSLEEERKLDECRWKALKKLNTNGKTIKFIAPLWQMAALTLNHLWVRAQWMMLMLKDMTAHWLLGAKQGSPFTHTMWMKGEPTELKYSFDFISISERKHFHSTHEYFSTS